MLRVEGYINLNWRVEMAKFETEKEATIYRDKEVEKETSKMCPLLAGPCSFHCVCFADSLPRVNERQDGDQWHVDFIGCDNHMLKGPNEAK